MTLHERIVRLSSRQRECLYLVHEGYSGKAVAAVLGISPNMVKEHLEAARKTLGVEKSLRAARMLVAETGLPPKVGGIEVGVGIHPTDGATVRPSARPAVAPEAPEVDLIQESMALYRPPTIGTRRSIPWPFRTAGRPSNDVGRTAKIAQVLACAAALGMIAMVLIIMAFAVRQMFVQGLSFDAGAK